MKKMERRTKLQKILNRLDGTNERTASAIRDFEGGVKDLRDKLQNEIQVSTLEEVNLKINRLRKSVDLNPILENIKTLEASFKESILSILNNIETKSTELSLLNSKNDKNLNTKTSELGSEINTLRGELDTLIKNNQTELNLINNEISTIIESSKNLVSKEELKTSTEIAESAVIENKEQDKEIKNVQESVEKLRRDMLIRVAEKGGGNMDRQIFIGGVDPLTKYTDINLKAGSNVTLTYTNNNTTKKVDVTIASSGGGGSVGGTVRQIQTISVSSTIGTVAGTDQVYLCDQGILITLPPALGDTNLYTIKNISNSSVAVVGDGAETIDDQANIIMPVKYTSVDLVSDGSNFKIT